MVAILRVTFRAFHRRNGGRASGITSGSSRAITLIAAAGHLVRRWRLWAGAFLGCGEFPDFETAFYHSAATAPRSATATSACPEQWRLLGPLEAMTGVLLFGLSTATVFAVWAG